MGDQATLESYPRAFQNDHQGFLYLPLTGFPTNVVVTVTVPVSVETVVVESVIVTVKTSVSVEAIVVVVVVVVVSTSTSVVKEVAVVVLRAISISTEVEVVSVTVK
jgi:hypothetical protein